MADPVTMAGIGIGSSILGGITGAAGSEEQAQAAQLQIQGSMLQTVSKAFGLQVEAQQYDYGAQVAQYQANIDIMNESIAKQNATYERDTADRKMEQSEMAARYNEGLAKAAQGASGIAINSGSSTNARESMVEIGRYDAATIEADGARKAYAFDVEAMQDVAQANLHTYASQMNTVQATNARTAAGLTMQAIPIQQQAMGVAQASGDIGAFGSIVGAAGSVASKWGQASSLNLFG